MLIYFARKSDIYVQLANRSMLLREIGSLKITRQTWLGACKYWSLCSTWLATNLYCITLFDVFSIYWSMGSQHIFRFFLLSVREEAICLIRTILCRDASIKLFSFVKVCQPLPAHTLLLFKNISLHHFSEYHWQFLCIEKVNCTREWRVRRCLGLFT